MSSEFAIRAAGLSKCYQVYEQPHDRLKQMIIPRLARMVRRPPPRYYREFWALRDVDLAVEMGETFGIVGRNGSGKSTLLQLVAGTLTPSGGKIDTRGRIAAILELGAGFNPEFTGRENALLSASLYGLSPADARAKMPAIVEFAEIGDFIDQPVKTYSSGMVVRLAFAVIAHVDADILIVDEALAVGDAFFTQKCMRFLREFKSRGTIFFVSHDTQAIQSLCDRAALLEHGRVKLVGDARTVSETYLEDLYGQQQPIEARQRVSAAHGEKAAMAAADELVSAASATLAAANRLEIFRFDLSGPGFGAGGARIRSTSLLDVEGRPLAQIHGGEPVILEIVVEAATGLERPIVGFYVKDRLGQYLFGDNTYLTYRGSPQRVSSGAIFRARFQFRMPILPAGDYFVAPAVADGTQENHVQHHWLHEALMFRSASTVVAGGLVGIPMKRIELQVDALAESA